MANQQQGVPNGGNGSGNQGTTTEDPIKVAIHLSALAIEKQASTQVHMLDLQRSMFQEIRSNKRRLDKVEDRLLMLEARQDLNPQIPDFEVVYLEDDIPDMIPNPKGSGPTVGAAENGTAPPILKKRDLKIKPGSDRLVCPRCNNDYSHTYALKHVNKPCLG